ncbi:hypothetical protein VTI74DRAFT_1317 [Chaetomium olivicolor]
MLWQSFWAQFLVVCAGFRKVALGLTAGGVSSRLRSVGPFPLLRLSCHHVLLSPAALTSRCLVGVVPPNGMTDHSERERHANQGRAAGVPHGGLITNPARLLWRRCRACGLHCRLGSLPPPLNTYPRPHLFDMQDFAAPHRMELMAGQEVSQVKMDAAVVTIFARIVQLA